MKRPARFVFVHLGVRAQIPRASESLIKTVIEAAVRFYKRGRYLKVEGLGEAALPLPLIPQGFLMNDICPRSIKREIFINIYRLLRSVSHSQKNRCWVMIIE